MLDGLLGRGFSSKCKSLIKLTRSRIDVNRRNKDARQRIMKKDIADLLANGLDINACGRVKQTEEFFAGLNLLFCYDFVEQSCEYIVKHLSVMQKQRECPEECREAVSSLMFAAARFSDFPELRDLRDMFQERYGNSLEYFVNQKFVEKLSSKPPTMEKKLQLLQNIALEFSITWDSRDFEQRMATPSAFTQHQHEINRPFHVTDDKYTLPNGKDTVPKRNKSRVSSNEKGEPVNDRHGMGNGLEGNGHKALTSREETIPKRDNHDISFRGRQEFAADKHGFLNGKEGSMLKTAGSGSSSPGKRPELIDDGYKLHNDGLNIVPGRDGWDHPSYGRPEAAVSGARLPVKNAGKDVSSAGYNHGRQQNIVGSTRKVEEGTDRLKSYYNNVPPPYIRSKDNGMPPPYIKPKDSKYGDNIGSKHSSSDCDGGSMDLSTHNKANSVNRSEKIQIGSEHPNYEGQEVGPARVKSRGHEKDHHCQDDVPLPKPRSIRRKHSKPSSSHDDLGNFEDAGAAKRSSSSRRRENSRKGLQILFDDEHYRKDEEERMIDKWLLHYSKKPSNYEPGKVRRKSKPHPSHQIAADAGGSTHHIRGDGSNAEPEIVPPARSVSLPHEQTAPSETEKVFARASTFQPDNQARHVHPKLPDYDDLAARFAALRGR